MTEPLRSDDPALERIKEEAALQPRVWVRTTTHCNNRCLFCLDGDTAGHGHLPPDEVKTRIREGAKPDARLVLSGGEASIHPNFLDFVEFARTCGYAWIQTITNGRMFGTPGFAQAAADRGLNEVTFSMHGHTADLHDTLTGVSGAFRQALKGMILLLKDGRVVVNVDVVINGLNYRHLREILDFYIRLGVHEFDLLQIVPFGRAWHPGNRERLFYDIGDAYDHLNRAFKLASQPGMFIWTNRFPAAYLEGVESLIQDPHKLFDEVRGRREEFAQSLLTGTPLHCHGERCSYCFLNDFCSRLHDLDRRRTDQTYERLELDLRSDPPATPARALPYLHDRLAELEIRASTAAEATSFLSAFPDRTWPEVTLRLEEASGFDPARWPMVTRLKSESAADLPFLEGVGLPLTLGVTPATHAWIRAYVARSPRPCRLYFPEVSTLAEARSMWIDPSEFLGSLPPDRCEVEEMPFCLFPNPAVSRPTLSLDTLDSDGRIDIGRFTRRAIDRDYRVYSNRCETCLRRKDCPGIGINWVRVFGFRLLRPLGDDPVKPPPKKIKK